MHVIFFKKKKRERVKFIIILTAYRSNNPNNNLIQIPLYVTAEIYQIRIKLFTFSIAALHVNSYIISNVNVRCMCDSL